MKHTEKVLRVFQHDGCGGMGYIGTYLEQQRMPYEIIHINQGESIPASLQDVAGLIFLGSNHSINDNYSWIEDEIALIKRATQAALPVLGICFGGQLISKALGGNVEQAPNMQIGWYRLDATPEAVKLLGPQLPVSLEVFEWHNDTFSMPPGSIPLFHGSCIKNQGFVLGRCLALQFHLEITQNKIEQCLLHDSDSLGNSSECIQNNEQMLDDLTARINRLHMGVN
jgi:GMP synthase-like glutamine amidotransferase